METTRRIPSLDGLRGLAILMVMLYHFRGVLDRDHLAHRVMASAFGLGWTGVDLFFVLSGFLITGILLETRTSANYFGGFYARRILRIFPLYYFSLLVIWWVHPPVGWRYVFYAQNWLWPDSPAVSHFWSLAVEEQFYLIWPLLVYRFPASRILKISVAAVFACAGLRIALLLAGVNGGRVYVNTFTRLDALMAGAACACLIRREDCVRPWFKWLWIAPIAALLILKYSPLIGSGAARGTIRHVGYNAIPICYAAFLLFAVTTSRGPLSRFLSSSPMRMLGKYSYGAYVWNLLAPGLVRRAERHWLHTPLPAIVNLPVLIAATLAASMASYALIERPFLKLKRHFDPRLISRASAMAGST